MVVEVTYLTWTQDNLLREVSYQGQREDKPADSGTFNSASTEEALVTLLPVAANASPKPTETSGAPSFASTRRTFRRIIE